MSDGYRRYDLAGRDLARMRDRDAACAEVRAKRPGKKAGRHHFFVIDNSGSMTEEILSVQNNINKNFADIIGKKRSRLPVIMVNEPWRCAVAAVGLCQRPYRQARRAARPQQSPATTRRAFITTASRSKAGIPSVASLVR